MKVVLDTNVLVSAMLWNGESSKLMEKLRSETHEIYSTPELIEELLKVLQRDFEMTLEEAEEETGKKITAVVELVLPRRRFHIVEEDPDDNKVVDCAVESASDYIVSKDRHLLKFGKICGIKVIKPAEMLENLKSKH